jgi:hypothetical protein
LALRQQLVTPCVQTHISPRFETVDENFAPVRAWPCDRIAGGQLVISSENISWAIVEFRLAYPSKSIGCFDQDIDMPSDLRIVVSNDSEVSKIPNYDLGDRIF